MRRRAAAIVALVTALATTRSWTVQNAPTDSCATHSETDEGLTDVDCRATATRQV